MAAYASVHLMAPFKVIFTDPRADFSACPEELGAKVLGDKDELCDRPAAVLTPPVGLEPAGTGKEAEGGKSWAGFLTVRRRAGIYQRKKSVSVRGGSGGWNRSTISWRVRTRVIQASMLP